MPELTLEQRALQDRARAEQREADAGVVEGRLDPDCSCRRMEYPHCENYGCSALKQIAAAIRRSGEEPCPTTLQAQRQTAKRCAEIAAEHGEWRTLRERYPEQIVGSGCDEAYGADLVEAAIIKEFKL